MATRKFISITYLMMDIIPVVTTLSQFLQRRNLDVAQVQVYHIYSIKAYFTFTQPPGPICSFLLWHINFYKIFESNKKCIPYRFYLNALCCFLCSYCIQIVSPRWSCLVPFRTWRCWRIQTKQLGTTSSFCRMTSTQFSLNQMLLSGGLGCTLKAMKFLGAPLTTSQPLGQPSLMHSCPISATGELLSLS